jgi:hypothetical protein
MPNTQAITIPATAPFDNVFNFGGEGIVLDVFEDVRVGVELVAAGLVGIVVVVVVGEMTLKPFTCMPNTIVCTDVVTVEGTTIIAGLKVLPD